jgi:uncharacterized protein YdeI (YjbR/CyaY-like superfamily)
MSSEDPVLFETRAEWRRWLKANHNNEKEVWLLRYNKDSGKRSIPYDDAVEEAVCYGWIDGKLKNLDKERFMIRFTPRKDDSVWSLANKNKALRMIEKGKMTEHGLKKIKIAKENGAWENAYSSRDVPDLPSDLKAALKKDGRAWENFREFANTYKIGYISWVVSAKKTETRAKRISLIVERAREKKRPGVDP